jgi:CRP-like cAMP-binding protein
MLASRRSGSTAESAVSLRETLIAAGLTPNLADELEAMPQKVVYIDPRRPFRDSGVPRDEVIFVRSGILSKFKIDGAARRQIVALRFPGEGILPRPGPSSYGIQAIVPSEVLIGSGDDFNRIVDKHPELQKFFWRLTQRNEAIGYEWLINCGRRDSTARVAHLLCETAVRSQANVPDEPLHNPFTQQQIAEITGQTSVNVNRVMADLERQGLIERRGRDIQFTDWSEMRRVASFQPEYLD